MGDIWWDRKGIIDRPDCGGEGFQVIPVDSSVASIPKQRVRLTVISNKIGIITKLKHPNNPVTITGKQSNDFHDVSIPNNSKLKIIHVDNTIIAMVLLSVSN